MARPRREFSPAIVAADRAARRVRPRTDVLPPTAPGTLYLPETPATAVEVAPRLLGKVLCGQGAAGEVQTLVVTEVEAYDGPSDRACHASRGRTPRTEVMFWPAGHWYVYRCYGIHWLANLVVGPADYPAAILLRGAGRLVGPGNLAAHLGLNGPDHHGHRAEPPPTGRLWLEDRGLRPPPDEVQQTARIGVQSSGEPWATCLWRWVWVMPKTDVSGSGDTRMASPRPATRLRRHRAAAATPT